MRFSCYRGVRVSVRFSCYTARVASVSVRFSCHKEGGGGGGCQCISEIFML